MRHGMASSVEYKAWTSMLNRVYHWKKSNKKIDGEMIDPEMRDFVTFYEIMGDRPEGYRLGRYDMTEGFTEENTAWMPKGGYSDR